MMQANLTYIIVVICVIAAALLVWQEIRRTSKTFLGLRVVAVIVAACMIACIALPVGFQQDVNRQDSETSILLTSGFSTDSLLPYKNARIYTTDRDVKKSLPQAILLGDIEQLTDSIKNGELVIYGEGLSKTDLERLGKIPVLFHSQPVPGGVTNISWNSSLKSGEVIRVQGSYHNNQGKKVRLVLKGLNTDLDTLTIRPNATVNFELSSRPKIRGKTVYSLQSVIGTDTLTLGSIPVEVSPAKPLRVLLLSASPNFENRFLKNWLSANGYQVAEHSAISKDKFSTGYINMHEFPLARLSASILNKFDVVIGDLSVLNGLNSAETSALKQQVANTGLGIVVRADSSGKNSWLQTNFSAEPAVAKEVIGSLTIDGKKSASNKLSGGTAYIRYQNGTQPLIVNSQNRILASSDINGAGKIIFTTLDRTYAWVLGGNQTDYAAFWSALIGKAARRDTVTKINVALSAIPYVNESVDLQVTGGDSAPLFVNGANAAALQNAAMPFERLATYWPDKAGWQSLSTNGRSANWYTYGTNDWQTLRSLAKTAATLKYAAGHQSSGNVTKQIHQKVRIEVPKIYFYILLLAACTFLWIEAKLS